VLIVASLERSTFEAFKACIGCFSYLCDSLYNVLIVFVCYFQISEVVNHMKDLIEFSPNNAEHA
jgi:ABC-type arginine transport system permease subunit